MYSSVLQSRRLGVFDRVCFASLARCVLLLAYLRFIFVVFCYRLICEPVNLLMFSDTYYHVCLLCRSDASHADSRESAGLACSNTVHSQKKRRVVIYRRAVPLILARRLGVSEQDVAAWSR